MASSYKGSFARLRCGAPFNEDAEGDNNSNGNDDELCKRVERFEEEGDNADTGLALMLGCLVWSGSLKSILEQFEDIRLLALEVFRIVWRVSDVGDGML